ncbi:hypothetical protein MYX78_13070, partial [Acidobacteria bacterium AH-259-G07]|nr:hypothetical protein [Acidobacteria bacterium AH-259-G07]
YQESHQNSEGSYVIPGLLPGSYLIFIEPLLPSFTGGSRVGPFDNRFRLSASLRKYGNVCGERSVAGKPFRG